MSAVDESDGEAEESKSSSTALVPRSVDPTLRFAPHRDRAGRNLVMWHAVGLASFIAIPAIGAAGAAVGIGAVAYGWLSTLLRGQAPEQILRARASLASNPERALGILTRWARSAAPAAHRLEAAGHVAVLRLDAGDVAGAIDILRFETRDESRPVHVRSLERGLIGELMRSILAWLSPGAFPRVAGAAAFELRPEQREGLSRPGDVDEFSDLVQLLRVLESAAGDNREAALLAWRECRDSDLGRRFPGLLLIAHAAAARRLPELRDELESHLSSNPDAQGFLQKVFPEFGAGSVRDIYREAALPADGGDEADRALAIVSAPERVTLAASQVARPNDYRAITTSVLWRWMAIGGGVGIGMIGLGALAGGFVGAWTAGMAAAYLGAPVTVIGAIRGMRVARRRLRLAPLWRLDPRPPEPWLDEFERCPLVRGGSAAVSREHLSLFVASVQAEAELAEGRAFAAWSTVEWYVRGFSAAHLEAGALYPVASSLIRVATLSGHTAEAQRVLQALHAAPADRDRRGRTGYGTAPRALALASALVSARMGKWTQAAEQLRTAASLPGVWMSEQDASLYDLVALVARHRTHTDVGKPNQERLEQHAEWLQHLLPELYEDIRDV